MVSHTLEADRDARLCIVCALADNCAMLAIGAISMVPEDLLPKSESSARTKHAALLLAECRRPILFRRHAGVHIVIGLMYFLTPGVIDLRVHIGVSILQELETLLLDEGGEIRHLRCKEVPQAAIKLGVHFPVGRTHLRGDLAVVTEDCAIDIKVEVRIGSHVLLILRRSTSHRNKTAWATVTKPQVI